jgi:hypothetical protein
VIGGILGGVFTPPEVGAVLLGYVLLLWLFYRTAQPGRLYAAVVEAGYISGMTLFMAATSSFLGFMMARDLVSQHVVDVVTGISTNKYVVDHGDRPDHHGSLPRSSRSCCRTCSSTTPCRKNERRRLKTVQPQGAVRSAERGVLPYAAASAGAPQRRG